MCRSAGVSPGRRRATRLNSSVSAWKDGYRPRSYREPALASSGTLMSLRTIPPFRAGILCGRVFRLGARVAAQRASLGPAAEASRCTFRKRHQGTLSGALRSEARRERSTREGGFPCRSVGRCAPAASLGRGRGTRTSTAPQLHNQIKPQISTGIPGAHPLTTRPGFPYTVNRVYQRTGFCTRFMGITFRKNELYLPYTR